jgi:DNA-binding transcriptional regulator YdaS (Cro superfamily)
VVKLSGVRAAGITRAICGRSALKQSRPRISWGRMLRTLIGYREAVREHEKGRNSPQDFG